MRVGRCEMTHSLSLISASARAQDVGAVLKGEKKKKYPETLRTRRKALIRTIRIVERDLSLNTARTSGEVQPRERVRGSAVGRKLPRVTPQCGVGGCLAEGSLEEQVWGGSP